MTITSPDYSGASDSPRAPSDSHHRRSANALRSGDLTIPEMPFDYSRNAISPLRKSDFTAPEK